MKVKEKVLEYLEERRGEPISGTELAERLSVSRNAVWKAIKSLQKEGYVISGVTNRGYILDDSNDILSRQSIEPFLQGMARELRLEVYKSVTSTNTVAKTMAMDGEPEGKVIIAEEQTKGKGRMGRSFYSPKGTGIYFSILLRPQMKAEEALFITTSAAVAVARAIEKISDCKAQIKWVNDIYCDGKKVCGILTEAGVDFESQGLEYAVLGIGINVAKPAGDFPEELQDKATSLFGDKPNQAETRSRLVAEVLNEFWECYRQGATKEYLTEYRERSFLIGQQVYVVNQEELGLARVIDIDEEARLVVQRQNGTLQALSSGEVSVKPAIDQA